MKPMQQCGVLLAAIFASTAAAVDIAQDLPRQADIAVNGVELCLDADAVAATLGRTPHWTKQIDDLDFHADFLNSDKSERWTLIGHPGDAHTGFEMRLARAKAEDQGYPALDVAHFATGKGVTLGMSPAELAQLLGPGKAVKQGASLRVEYEIDPDRYPWNQRFGKRCGFPGYAAEYTFVDGRLAAFRFGSPYP